MGKDPLAILRDQTADIGVSATTHVIETADPIHRVVSDYATDHDADLIVMGTHGRAGLARYLLGSITEKIVRVPDIVVLTISPPEDD